MSWETYYSPVTLDEALALLQAHGPEARVIAGGTDLLLEIEKGQRRPRTLIDIRHIPGLDRIELRDGWVHVGPAVTHSEAQNSEIFLDFAYPLARACWEVGAPQIRNRGTIAGNVITASPANDTITPLWAMDATVTLLSAQGRRTLTFAEFYRGVRKTALASDEMLVDIAFPALSSRERGVFIKLGLRKSQAISVINIAAVLELDGERVLRARLAFGSVAPTIVRSPDAEAFLVGRSLDAETISRAAELAAASVRPIDDVRAPADYRLATVRALTSRALQQIADGKEREGWPLQRPALRVDSTHNTPAARTHSSLGDEPIDLTVNGRRYSVRGAQHKTLLHLLRDDLGLTGAKEGCAEGECGACTVHLDGAAVMACLVPAPAAHGSEVVTIEGIGSEAQMHPLQRAFIDASAVQCGYCSPGFIMSAAKLLEEHPEPDRDMIVQALSGNLCRCTGYANIITAVEQAADAMKASHEDH